MHSAHRYIDSIAFCFSFFQLHCLAYIATHTHTLRVVSTACSLRTTIILTRSLVRLLTPTQAQAHSTALLSHHKTLSLHGSFKLHLVSVVSRQSLCDRHTSKFTSSETTVALYIILRALCLHNQSQLCEIILYANRLAGIHLLIRVVFFCFGFESNILSAILAIAIDQSSCN